MESLALAMVICLRDAGKQDSALFNRLRDL